MDIPQLFNSIGFYVMQIFAAILIVGSYLMLRLVTAAKRSGYAVHTTTACRNMALFITGFMVITGLLIYDNRGIYLATLQDWVSSPLSFIGLLTVFIVISLPLVLLSAIRLIFHPRS